MQTGYNMISLAGFISSSTFSGLDAQLTPLTLWKNLYEIVMSGKSNIIGSTTSQIQKHIIDKVFHANDSRLLMHVDLINNPVSGQNPVTASYLAQ